MSKKTKQEESAPEAIDSELSNIIEAALFAADEPLGIRKLLALFPDDAQPSKVDVQNVLLGLEERCAQRGIELRRIGKGWRFQSKEKYAPWLRKLGAQKPPRYSRALLETLAIIAYRQPVTRGDIEEIRGVGVSSETIRTLEEREWVQQIGHRDVPGRPALFGTTQGFLEYFNMVSLRELPELMDKRALGEIAKDMNLTLPMDGVQPEAEAAAELEGGAEIIALHPNDGSAKDEQTTGTASAPEVANPTDEIENEPELADPEEVSDADSIVSEDDDHPEESDPNG